MAWSLRQKRWLAGLAEPLAALAFKGYRLASGQLMRRRALPKDGGPSPECILVVRLDTIGDVLLSEPAITALKKAFPQAVLDVVCGSGGRAVLQGNPAIDDFIVYDAPWHAAWRGRAISWRKEWPKLWGVLVQLRHRRYDLAVELRGDFRDIAFTAATGARVTVGCSWRGGRRLLDYDVPLDTRGHRVEFALGMVAAVGAEVEDPGVASGDPTRRATPRAPRLYLEEAVVERFSRLLPQEPGKLPVAFHLGAGFATKCLPAAHFAAVANRLARKHPGLRVVVVGGREEQLLVKEFTRLLKMTPIDLVGSLSLPETAALLGQCHLFIGNDSAPMHLAAAMGTPVVTFFGPSEPAKYHPYGVPYRLLEAELPCRPCDHVNCIHPENLCLTLIEPAEIVAAAEELLALPREALVSPKGGGKEVDHPSRVATG